MPTPLPRQPECRYCGHEEHSILRCGFDLGGASCPCPGHLRPGIYN